MAPAGDAPPISSAASGVALDASHRAVERMQGSAAAGSLPEVMVSVDPFAGRFRPGSNREPVLGLLPDGWETGCIIANNADGPRVVLD